MRASCQEPGLRPSEKSQRLHLHQRQHQHTGGGNHAIFQIHSAACTGGQQRWARRPAPLLTFHASNVNMTSTLNEPLSTKSPGKARESEGRQMRGQHMHMTAEAIGDWYARNTQPKVRKGALLQR